MNSPNQEASKAPTWLDKIGVCSAIGIILLDLDLIYEQTFLTWAEGDQMVGFSIAHILGPLILLLYAISLVFLAGVLLFPFQSWLTKRPPPKINWAVVLIVIAGYCLNFTPYRFWRRATIAVKGPGPHAAQELVYAAHDGDKSTVDLLLKHGVPVDISNKGSTALAGACAGSQREMARFLLAKGANIRLAPECREFLADIDLH
jgi:hypothetical protein